MQAVDTVLNAAAIDPLPQGSGELPPSAVRVRKDWTRAALALVDGTLSLSAYARIRDRARAQLESEPPPITTAVMSET
jgi:hypothetical protein